MSAQRDDLKQENALKINQSQIDFTTDDAPYDVPRVTRNRTRMPQDTDS